MQIVKANIFTFNEAHGDDKILRQEEIYENQNSVYGKIRIVSVLSRYWHCYYMQQWQDSVNMKVIWLE